MNAAATKYWQYHWNVSNQLIQADLVNDGQTIRTVQFQYDAFGRRTIKQTTQGGSTISTNYIYDGEDIILQITSDGTNTTATHYVHGPGIDEPLAKIQGTQTYYYHADGLGSIVAITDSNKTIVQRYSYDTYGMLIAIQAPEFNNSYAFTGREWDKELGLYYYRARYYDPMEGRFISRDPIGFAGGDVNVYAYVGNQPVMIKDPSGLAGIGGGMYYVFGGEMSVSSSICCENNTEYEVKIFTSCGGVGLGLKGGPPISSTVASFSSRVGCPRTRYYFKHENTFVARSVDVQGDSRGPSAGLNLGNYGISTAWVFCSDTVISKRKVGCCD